MATQTTINWPDSLLEQARKAAAANQNSLQSFVLQSVSERLRQPNSKTNGTPIQGQHSKQTNGRVIGKNWPRERMMKDKDWMESNYQTLADTYPNQWIIVHGQKVVGAHRDLAIASEQAEPLVGDVFKAHALMEFMEGRLRVY